MYLSGRQVGIKVMHCVPVRNIVKDITRNFHSQKNLFVSLKSKRRAITRSLENRVTSAQKMRCLCCKKMRSHSASKTLKYNTWLRIYFIILTAPIITSYNSGENF